MSRKLIYSARRKTGSALQLWQQVYRYIGDANKRSNETRGTHYDKLSTFVNFIGDQFRLQNLKNLRDKHLVAYVEWAKSKEYGSSTIKNTLSAIRYLHDHIPDAKFELSDNNVINTLLQQNTVGRGEIPQKHELPQRHYIGTGKNPAWSETERENGTLLALKMKRYDVALSIQFGLALGTRLHETYRQKRKSISKALETGYLTTKGKGGLIRDIPVNSRLAREVLELAYKQTSTTKERAFVDTDQQTHKAMKRVQNWIYNHREKFTDSPDRQLTYHGLRHTYAQQEYERIEKLTGDPREALRQVAEQMGHHREWITKVYLSS